MSEYKDLIDTWYINHRITLYLLDAIKETTLEARPFGMTGRSVKVMFAHMHNVRMMWLQPIHSDLAKSIKKLPVRGNTNQKSITKASLTEALTQSGESLGKGIEQRLELKKTGIFKPNPTAFIGYLISHEGYHRGEICMTLSQAGHQLSDEVMYGMWVWDKR